MAVKFTGFSGLQMSSYSSTLLVQNPTWAMSMFLRIPTDYGTPEGLNSTYVAIGLNQRNTIDNLVLPGGRVITSVPLVDNVFAVGFESMADTSKVMVDFVASSNGERCLSGRPISIGAPGHHLLFGPDPVSKIMQVYLDGDPIVDGKDGAFLDDPYQGPTKLRYQGLPDGTVYQDTGLPVTPIPFAIRLGNVDLINNFYGTYTPTNTPGPYGAVSFEIERFAVWDGYFPTNDEVIKIGTKSVTPDQIGTPGSLKIYWPLTTTSGTPQNGDQVLVNTANPGTFDLTIV